MKISSRSRDPMCRKIGLLFFLFIMLAFTTPASSLTYCSSFSECNRFGDNPPGESPNTDDRIYYYTKAIELGGQYSDNLYLKRGQLYFSKSQTREALGDFNKAAQINTTSPDIYFWRGALYFYLKRYKDAVSDFEKVYDFSEKRENGLKDTALLFPTVKLPKLIRDGLEKEKMFKDAFLLFLAASYFYAGEKEEAKKHLMSITGTVGDPDNINRALFSLRAQMPSQNFDKQHFLPRATYSAMQEFLKASGYRTLDSRALFSLFCLGVLFQVLIMTCFPMQNIQWRIAGGTLIGSIIVFLSLLVMLNFFVVEADWIRKVPVVDAIFGLFVVLVVFGVFLSLLFIFSSFTSDIVRLYLQDLAPRMNDQIFLSVTLVFLYSVLTTFRMPVVKMGLFFLCLAFILVARKVSRPVKWLSLSRYFSEGRFFVYVWFLFLNAFLIFIEFPRQACMEASLLSFSVAVNPLELILAGMASLNLFSIASAPAALYLYAKSDTFHPGEIRRDFPSIYLRLNPDMPFPPGVSLTTILMVGGICVLNYIYKFVSDTMLVYSSIVLIPPVVSLFSKKPKAPKESGTCKSGTGS